MGPELQGSKWKRANQTVFNILRLTPSIYTIPKSNAHQSGILHGTLPALVSSHYLELKKMRKRIQEHVYRD